MFTGISIFEENKMTKEMMLIKKRFGISEEEAIQLEQQGLYGIFVTPTYDKSEPDNEIHLKHQLYQNFNTKEERLVGEVTEKVTYTISKEKGFQITSTSFTNK